MVSESLNISTQIWAITLGVIFLVTLGDLIWAWFHRNSITTLKEAAIWTGIYVSAAIAFGISLEVGEGRPSQLSSLPVG